MKPETIENLKVKIHANAVRQGWWEDGDENLVQKRALVICELAEAIEADRKGKFAKREEFENRCKELLLSLHTNDIQNYSQILNERCEQVFKQQFENYIKDSVEDELADAAIRIMDLMAFHEVPYLFLNDLYPQPCLSTLLFRVSNCLSSDTNVLYNSAMTHIELYCGKKNIDLLWHIEKKMEYNLSRPYKHGKAY